MFNIYLYSSVLNSTTCIDFFLWVFRHPVTSMVYGCNALVVKPAISLSPMFVVSVLNSHGFEQLKEGKLDPGQRGSLNAVMFTLLCLYPFVIGCIQYISWSFYTIRKSKTVDMTLTVVGDVESG